MRLARKLTLALVLGIVAVMGTYAWVQIGREVVLDKNDLDRARRMGRALRVMLERAWEQGGEERVEGHLRAIAAKTGWRARLVPDDEFFRTIKPRWTDAQRQEFRTSHLVRVRRSDPDGHEWQYVYLLVGGERGERGVLEAGETLAGEMHFIRMSRLGVLGATLGVVLVCAGIAFLLQSRLVGRPVQQLRDKARRAGTGDFSRPLVLRQRDEIGELARELNDMCEQLAEAQRRLAEETDARLQALEQLRHTDRLATVGQLAAGVAHELGTPLSVVSARAQLLAGSDLPASEVQANARRIGEQADRMTEIIEQLLDFSRRRKARLELVPLQHVVTRTLDLLGTVAERARIVLVADVPDRPLVARVDQNQLQQALANVVLNGIQAMPHGGRLTVALEARLAARPDATGDVAVPCVAIVIQDEGMGIAPAALDRIFEPFYTTKGVGEGTGLGLAVAHGIVAEHGGWIEVVSEEGRGSRFAIVLPAASSGALAAAS